MRRNQDVGVIHQPSRNRRIGLAVAVGQASVLAGLETAAYAGQEPVGQASVLAGLGRQPGMAALPTPYKRQSHPHRGQFWEQVSTISQVSGMVSHLPVSDFSNLLVVIPISLSIIDIAQFAFAAQECL